MADKPSLLLVVCQPDEAWAKYNIADDKHRIAKCLGWPADTPHLRTVSAISEVLPKEFPESAVIICGSRHMLDENLPWMNAAKVFVRRVYKQGKPMLGLCFGHQLICEALGGIIGQSDRPEKGMAKVTLTGDGSSDPLFEDMGAAIQVAAHHSNSVKKLPPTGNVRVLASNPSDSRQALAIGSRVRTVQFHPDISAKDISKVLTATKDKLLESGYFKNYAEIERHIGEIKNSSLDKSRQVLLNFIAHFVS